MDRIKQYRQIIQELFTASQIMLLSDYLREEAILSKFRHLSEHRQKQLEEYLDFLLQKDQTTPVN